MLIMSNNLWNCDQNSPEWEARGEDCSANARVHGLAKAYKIVLPDIIGYQEMSRHMEHLLFLRLHRLRFSGSKETVYELVSGGYTPLMFRYDKYRLLESGHFLFPAECPPYEGSFNDADTKGYTYGVFEHRTTAKRVAVFSTHLWWKSADLKDENYQNGSAEARAAQIGIICKKADEIIAKYDCPVILMGDLNDVLGSPCLNAAKSAGFEETHNICVGHKDGRRGLHYCYADGWKHEPDGVYEEAIDHILIKNAGNTVVNEFRRFMEPFFEPLSDHFPVYIDITL